MSDNKRARIINASRWAALLMVIFLTGLLILGISLRSTTGQKYSSLYVMPHPDDEFQVWSLVEDREDQYDVFAFLTKGDGTGYCEEESFSNALHTELGEVEPSVAPQGRGSDECKAARIESALGFFEQMSQTDTTVPGLFGEMKTYGPYEDIEVDICQTVDGVEDCSDPILSVDVWLDELDRGAIVFFDLGDGSLTEESVQWAIQTVLDNKEEWGLSVDTEFANIVGSFGNDQNGKCYQYPHSDHMAVRNTLWNVDFGVGPQLGATCFLDPDQSMTAIVSDQAVMDAFELSEDRQRIGAHTRYYGWLHDDVYEVSRYSQRTLFQKVQSFWVRFE